MIVNDLSLLFNRSRDNFLILSLILLATPLRLQSLI